MKQIIPRSTITEIVGYRDAALTAYAEAIDAIEAANEAVQKAQALVRLAAPFDNPHYLEAHREEIAAFYGVIKMPTSRDAYLRTARRLTDIKVWAHLIQHTELEQLMDKQAKDELRKQMAYIPERVDPDTGELINREEIEKGLPDISVETIEATLLGFASNASDIFRRGIANAFAQLDRKFRSHDGFKIGSRIILDRAFDDYGSWNYYRAQRDTLTDIERIFLVLDGKSPKANYGGIVGIIEADRKAAGAGFMTKAQTESVGDYFKVRVFKNGNAHLWFTRDDLVEKVNQELAAFYGEVIGDGVDVPDREEDYTRNMTMTPARHFGFFPTPQKVVDRLIEEARLYRREGERRLVVLEPSAGTGRIALALDPKDTRLRCVEIQPELAQALRMKLELQGRAGVVRTADFLQMQVQPDLADRVIMNPPFDRQRDIDHVRHAWEFLKPGGRLVAVMSAGVEFRENKKAITFRKWVDTHGGKFWDLPAGSFEESGTNVNTCILVMEKSD